MKLETVLYARELGRPCVFVNFHDLAIPTLREQVAYLPLNVALYAANGAEQLLMSIRGIRRASWIGEHHGSAAGRQDNEAGYAGMAGSRCRIERAGLLGVRLPHVQLRADGRRHVRRRDG